MISDISISYLSIHIIDIRYNYLDSIIRINDSEIQFMMMVYLYEKYLFSKLRMISFIFIFSDRFSKIYHFFGRLISFKYNKFMRIGSSMKSSNLFFSKISDNEEFVFLKYFRYFINHDIRI